MKKITAEEKRLEENRQHRVFWKKWGPYLSERQWGTVREDYSESGEAWDYFPHDHARSRAYRWGEDGIAGISDIYQNLCFSIALWNGKDPILKERLFGLSGTEGNHGEDVKELYYYLDNTPTHSYMKYLYKYPHAAFPYSKLVKENKRRTRKQPEFEILDTGVFDEHKYFDVFIEYAKASPEDIIIKITICNRSLEDAPLVLLPTLWFRNTWTFTRSKNKPVIELTLRGKHRPVLKASHEHAGTYYLYFEEPDIILFTENETNHVRLSGMKNASPYAKDAFHDVIVQGNKDLLNGKTSGTKAAPLYQFQIQGHSSRTVWLRLSQDQKPKTLLEEGERILHTRISEADEFYGKFQRHHKDQDISMIQRQAFAGLLWNKQYYNYELETWQRGDPGQPSPPPERKHVRNSGWERLFNRDVISMPDKWEYPWYATWDLAFHCVPFAMIDADYAKKQMLLFLREWYMHPNGQLPAYEWALGDVNPPVHAWGCYKVYQIEKDMTGKGDLIFLKRAFHKLLLNFTWWVNRKDVDGHNIFQGGFLGLDNIGIFDRSKPLPTGGHLEQSDGTSWMAMYSLNMMLIALELAKEDHTYEDLASKFFEHFVHITEAFNSFGENQDIDLWDERDGFFYDVIHFENGETLPIKVRSLVGLIPLCAVCVIDAAMLERFPGFTKRLTWFRNHRKNLNKQLIIEKLTGEEKVIFSLVKKDRLIRILEKMFDEDEFLSIGGIRSLSKFYEKHPFILTLDGTEFCIDYEPGESTSGLFGGNSNWRGPVWLPVNYLLIEAIITYHTYFGESLRVEFPTRSGTYISLNDAARALSERIIHIFKRDRNGKRSVHFMYKIYENDPHFKDLILFYEYFHGDSCRGVGASHQTGWTALVARMIDVLCGVRS